MKAVIAPVKNFRKLQQVATQLKERPSNVPGLALIWGHTGYGKTTAAACIGNRIDANYMRANAAWTQASMLGDLCATYGLAETGSASVRLARLTKHMNSADSKPLLLDEADYLVKSKRLVETVRDLHDATQVPILLIGMAEFRKSVSRFPQLEGRCAHWFEFVPADADDVRAFCNATADVRIDDDLIEHLLKITGGSMRALTNAVHQLELHAKRRDKTSIALRDLGNRKLVLREVHTVNEATGDAPAADSKPAILRVAGQE